MYTYLSHFNEAHLKQTNRSQLTSNLLSDSNSHLFYLFKMGINFISINTCWKVSTLIIHCTEISYSIMHTNQNFNTHKPLPIITVFPLTYNGLVILHISAILDLPGTVYKSGITN